MSPYYRHALLAIAAAASAEASELTARELALAAGVQADPSADGSVCLLQREHGQRHHAQGGAGASESATAAFAATSPSTAKEAAPGIAAETANAANLTAVSKSAEAAKDLAAVQHETAHRATAADREAAHEVAREVKGLSEGVGLDYAAQSMLQADRGRGSQQRAATAAAAAAAAAVPVPRNKVVLMAIDAFPLCWMFGVDRIYLGCIGTGIAKFCVATVTLGIGGVVWGLIDFCMVLANAWQKEESLSALGMHATFAPGQVDTAFALAFVDLLAVPFWIMLAMFVKQKRAQWRSERLREAAMKSPHYGADPAAVAASSSKAS